jgi:hypothetical protein
MVRQMLAAAGALIVLVAFPLAPSAAADDGQMVLTESGKVRCLVSADNVPRGGGPMVVCQQSDGQPFGQSPWAASKYNERLNLAVKRGNGEFYWAKGSIAGPGAASGQDIVLSEGQTYHVNGWTIQPEKARTKFTYDATGKGMFFGVATLLQFSDR